MKQIKKLVFLWMFSIGFFMSLQNYTGIANSFAKTKELKAAASFRLEDQTGKQHDLSQYAGKTVFINFWATWCPNCMREMPHIQSLYQEYGRNQKDVIILTLANPSTKEYPNNSDISVEELKQFIQKKGYEFPVLFDTTGKVMDDYHIRAFPMNYVITKEGKVRGALSGSLSKEQIQKMIELTKQGK